MLLLSISFSYSHEFLIDSHTSINIQANFLVKMGLTCNKLQSGNRSSESFEKAESWARKGGYVFRPVFRNEIHESTYEKTQLNYNLSWRKEEASLRRRQSLRENPLINETFLENLRDKLRS